VTPPEPVPVAGDVAVGARPVGQRSPLRAVALPTEHGGWGLTAEPALLGLIVAPSVGGTALAVAAVLAFVARTPLKIVLVDRWRGRRLSRTALALRVAAAELAAFALLIAVAAVLSPGRTWLPALAFGPLVAVELWFDMRSRSRRLVPELAGAVGISAVAAMVALAGGADTAVALGLWAIVGARAVAAVPFAREQVLRFRGKGQDVRLMVATHVVAVVAAVVAALVEDRLVPGAAAIAALAAVHAAIAVGPPRRPTLLGIAQMVFGLVVVLVTGIGARLW
jgi:hypothetical protein